MASDSDDDGSMFSGFGSVDLNVRQININPDEMSISSVSSVHSSDLDSDDGDGADLRIDPNAGVVNFTDQLSDVNVTPFKEYVGIRHGLDPTEAIAKDYFDLIFKPVTVDVITNETNRYAGQCISTKPDAEWYETTSEEMRAYLGLVIIMGIHRLPSLKHYWSADPILGVYWNRLRFKKSVVLVRLSLSVVLVRLSVRSIFFFIVLFNSLSHFSITLM